MNILLIEPDKKLGGLYQAALEKAGHKVQLLAHAQDAVHAADKRRPDCVILELQLAAHSGVEFLHEFRSYSEWQGIPVVLLTMVPPESLQLTKDMMQTFGIVGFLYKPSVTLKQLVDTVSEIAI
jgi:two-component system KDP operon response regulator KdpE